MPGKPHPAHLSRHIVFDKIGRLKTDSTGTLLNAYVYDANGSLTKKCEGGTVTRTATDCTSSGGTVTALTYDPLNRLTQAVKGATTETYGHL